MDTTKRIPLFRSYLTAKDIAEGERVLRRNRSLSKGDEIVEFERALADYVGRKYCVVVNSGCSALRIGLRILDEQFWIPRFTYHGVIEICDEMGAFRCYCEYDSETYGAIVNSRTTLLTHIAGFPAVGSSEVFLEDACQGFGSKIKNRKIGTYGRIALLSFCQNKLITTGGEGGALLTDNSRYYSEALRIREYNYRMSSHQAAIGLSQLSRIDEIIANRRAMADKLKEKYPCALKELPGHFQTYQMYLVKPEVEVPDYVETKMRFDGCELLKEIPLDWSPVDVEA
jgi:dTDP-4-amino-4,6-dideoxygalactose transaminase